MRRILILLSADTWADAAPALISAREHARVPEAVSCGLLLNREPTPEEASEMRAMGGIQYLTPAGSPWDAAEALWQGEDDVLMAHPGIRFESRWDTRLIRLLPSGQSALTGMPPLEWDAFPDMAPLAADRFRNGRLILRRGIPLPCCAQPLHSAFLNPDFCFGPVRFFREMLRAPSDPSLRAYALHWELYTLNEPVVRMSCETAPPAMALDIPEGLEADAARFDQRYGIRRSEQLLTAQARTGIWSAEMSYPLRIPASLRLRLRMRRASIRSKAQPLCVTVFAPAPEESEELLREGLRHFRYAAALRNSALLVFAAASSRDRILRYHPNVLAYSTSCALPLRLESLPLTERIRFGKIHTLLAAAERIPSASHLIWMDYDALPCWMHPDTVFDWDAICTDRIAMALVDGKTDCSMIVVPGRLLDALAQEWLRICRDCLTDGRELPVEDVLWQQIADGHPEWFAFRDLSLPRQLFTLAL